jgi:hypothetical protein
MRKNKPSQLDSMQQSLLQNSSSSFLASMHAENGAREGEGKERKER